VSDAILTRDGPTAVPLAYTVPNGGELLPLTVRATMDGTGAGQAFYAVVQVIAPSGRIMGNFITSSIAAGASADVTWFPGADVEEDTAAAATTGVIIDQFLVDSKTSAETSGSAVLTSGVSYTVTAQGTFSFWNSTLEVGAPNANAIFQSSTSGRVSTQVGVDPECIFAFHRLSPSDALGHTNAFQYDLGSGLAYIAPQGGPYATPQPNYLYRYTVIGQGSVLKALVTDAGPYTDNYGKIQVTVYSTSGSASGGGGGALVPPDGADYSVLQPLSGVYAWNAALDGGSA
jgi:hypothetical protein